MLEMHYSAPPLWWTQTRFGTVLLVLFFLTWGLVIVNLAVFLLRQVHALFGQGRESSRPAAKPAPRQKAQK